MMGVVFVSYRIPQRRLEEHFQWNDEFYRAAGCRVFVVADRAYPVPDYVTCLVYPEPLEIFSIAKTKNFGIAAALAAGCDPIAVIDIDVAWTAQAWAAAQAPGQAIVHPLTFMAVDWPSRHACHHCDEGMGCVMAASAAWWQRVRYDERYVGYGSDDGRLRADFFRAGAKLTRDTFVYHIAHDPTVDQDNHSGHGRPDCWNRDTGFNPDMAERNNSLR
jgi:hypothetical protein